MVTCHETYFRRLGLTGWYHVNATVEYRQACLEFIKAMFDKKPVLDIMKKLRNIFRFDMLMSYDRVGYCLSQPIRSLEQAFDASSRGTQKSRSGSRSTEDELVDVEI